MEKECQPENMKTSDQEMDEESVQHKEEATKVLEQNGSGGVNADSSSESESQRILSGATSMSTSIRNVGGSSSSVDIEEESVQHNVEATKVLEQNGSGEVKADSSCECGLTTEYIVDGLCSMRRDQRVIAMLMINIIMNYLLHRQQQQGNGDAK